ncbi:MAG: 2-hydroxyacyl-CoA dehydratase family protein [Clostridiales bacterium]|nr:2-hydroxyacyl-CoA dehydratase family protein [Clostridiales bacterium]
MSIRKCACSSEAFLKLKYIYEHREEEAAKWRRLGKKVVGELGSDVPDEILIGGGMLPIRVYAEPDKPLTETDRYLEYAFDPVVRAQFEKIVDGTYASQIDALAVSNSTDVLIRTYLYLRELKRVEPQKAVPEVACIDWLFTRNYLYQTRNEGTIERFWKETEQWAGHAVTDEDIRKGAAICNENRQALRRMAELRHGSEVRINGSEALVIIGSAFFTDRETHTALVNQVTEDSGSWPVIRGPRIFVSGSNQEDTQLYDLIESAGAVIVGEDHDWGDRFYERDYNMDFDPVRAIVDRYMLREFSSKKAFVSQRVEALDCMADAVAAEGVIFYTNIYEEAASWDYPSQKKSLESRGIKTLNCVKMQWPVSKNEQLEAKIQSFVSGMKGDEQDV